MQGERWTAARSGVVVVWCVLGVAAPAGERDLARVPAQVGAALGEHGVQPPIVVAERPPDLLDEQPRRDR